MAKLKEGKGLEPAMDVSPGERQKYNWLNGDGPIDDDDQRAIVIHIPTVHLSPGAGVELWSGL